MTAKYGLWVNGVAPCCAMNCGSSLPLTTVVVKYGSDLGRVAIIMFWRDTAMLFLASASRCYTRSCSDSKVLCGKYSCMMASAVQRGRYTVTWALWRGVSEVVVDCRAAVGGLVAQQRSRLGDELRELWISRKLYVNSGILVKSV